MACSKFVLPEEMTIEILKRVPTMTEIEVSLLVISNSELDGLNRLMIARPVVDGIPQSVFRDYKCYLYVPLKFTVIGSSNGIICMVYGIHCYLWNPVTKKCKELPRFPGNQEAYEKNQEGKLAFYFDTFSNDYKVLRLLCHLTTTGGLPVLQLYSTNTNSWKEIHVHDTSPIKVMSYPSLKLGPVINGAMYMGRKEYVVSFDLHSEVCIAVPIPTFMVRYSDILDFEGSVAAIFGSVSEGSEISLWTLDNIDGKVSWTKKFNIALDDMGWIYSYLGAGVLFGRRKDRTVFFLYDYMKNDFKYIPLPDTRLKTILKYKETLASVGGFNHNLYEFGKTVFLL
ncbi:hypothetical protein POM88_047697 [Heracleum sosnowskyi]|uniref:F-box associated beta-propeller type 3 domain-containing protein n=1 Tax=Heracleum sosnowskyi TaxID=360622 RepID=A0AAD8GTR4_9APIA|nr:hypothetical protein POM88_047697 [Heracleum sosnowskyi]